MLQTILLSLLVLSPFNVFFCFQGERGSGNGRSKMRKKNYELSRNNSHYQKNLGHKTEYTFKTEYMCS